MAAADGMVAFSAVEEIAVDPALGYPKTYAKLCRARTALMPYAQGPPFAYLPYALQPQEALRSRELNQIFPIVDPEATPSVNPRGYVNLLWKQLDHLGNAGFDPGLFRLDPYGNVLYLHADAASPLAWDIDHWFPCSRGGQTVPTNLRLLQWQVCKKKHRKLEFLIPWWDLQLGISVNQFLSIFASRNMDFRNRGFSFMFPAGGSEELNALQVVDSHSFSQHFMEMKQQAGLAPAAIVSSPRISEASALIPLKINSSLRPNSPLIAGKKFPPDKDDTITDAHSSGIQRFQANISKENSNPNIDTSDRNPYFQIAMARDSLRQREEAKKKQAEISRLEDELNELKQNNESDRVALQELKTLLIKGRQRVEKNRRLAEAQSSDKALLEKMIQDAMDQSIVYKELVRLNQVATSALTVRFEAQRAFSKSPEDELSQKLKQADASERGIRPIWELRKRSRMDDTTFEEGRADSIETLCTGETRIPLKEELRISFREQQKAYEAGLSLGKDREESQETHTCGSAEKEAHNSLLFCKESQSHKEEYDSIEIDKENRSKGIAQKWFARSQKEDQEYGMTNERLKQLAITDGGCSKTTKSGEGSKGKSKKYVVAKEKVLPYDKPKKLGKHERYFLQTNVPKMKSPIMEKPYEEEDEDEHRKQLGKENIEKWLSILLGKTQEQLSSDSAPTDSQDNSTDRFFCKTNHMSLEKDIKFLKFKPMEEKAVSNPWFPVQKDKDRGCIESRNNEADVLSVNYLSEKNKNVKEVGSSNAGKGITGSRKSFKIKEREEKKAGPPWSASARGFTSLPSTPSVILGMGRGVDCVGEIPKVIGDDDSNQNKNSLPTNNKFIKTCSKAIKKVVNI